MLMMSKSLLRRLRRTVARYVLQGVEKLESLSNFYPEKMPLPRSGTQLLYIIDISFIFIGSLDFKALPSPSA